MTLSSKKRKQLAGAREAKRAKNKRDEDDLEAEDAREAANRAVHEAQVAEVMRWAFFLPFVITALTNMEEPRRFIEALGAVVVASEAIQTAAMQHYPAMRARVEGMIKGGHGFTKVFQRFVDTGQRLEPDEGDGNRSMYVLRTGDRAAKLDDPFRFLGKVVAEVARALFSVADLADLIPEAILTVIEGHGPSSAQGQAAEASRPRFHHQLRPRRDLLLTPRIPQAPSRVLPR
jgi:hypothetical protein